MQLPRSVRRLKHNCFTESGIKDVITTPYLKTIDQSAFSSCTELENVMLSDGLESIGDSAFSCSALKTIVLPATLKKIQRCAFEYCNNLRNVLLPAGKMTVTYNFETYTYSAKLAVSPEVKQLEYHPAYKHFGLEEVLFENDCQLEKICEGTFQATQLERIELPSSLTEIREAAFAGCT